MASTNYSSWEKYDVDNAMKEFDERESDEKVFKNRIKEQNSDLQVLEEVSFAAATIKSKAAVEALKAKGKGRRRRRQAPGLTAEPEQQRRVHHLQQASAAAQVVKDRLTAALDSRNKARKLQEDEDFEAALELFEAGLKQIEDLGAIFDRPEQQEKQPETMSHTHDHSHSHDQSSCSSSQCQSKENAKASDNDAENKFLQLGRTLRSDLKCGKGACLAKVGQLAKASGVLKEVLLSEDRNLEAWVLRAQTFRLMGVPLLAELHLGRLLQLSKDHRQGLIELELANAGIDLEINKAQEDRTNSPSLQDLNGEPQLLPPPPPAANVTCESNAANSSEFEFRTLLLEAQETFLQANVLFEEQYFKNAENRYQEVLRMTSKLKQLAESAQEPDRILVQLANLESKCYLNLSAQGILRNQEIEEILQYCNRALEMNESNITALLRRSKAFEESGQFTSALEDLQRCKRERSAQSIQDSSDAISLYVDQRIERIHFLMSCTGLNNQSQSTADPGTV